MSDAKIWFVCAKRTAADVAVGQPFTGECGRWLYTNCLKPLGKRRSDVGLWALDMGNVPCSDNDIVIAVGKPAHKSLGNMAAVSVPHPMAVFKRRDTGETARKIARIAAILKAEEDAQTVFEGSWPEFVPPGGGRFVYQRHDRGGIVHHDLRLESKNSGKSWGWTGAAIWASPTVAWSPRSQPASSWLASFAGSGPVGSLRLFGSTRTRITSLRRNWWKQPDSGRNSPRAHCRATRIILSGSSTITAFI